MATPMWPAPRPGYLDRPDDAYMLRRRRVSVADIRNQRVLFISPTKRVVRQIGTTASPDTRRRACWTCPTATRRCPAAAPS